MSRTGQATACLGSGRSGSLLAVDITFFDRALETDSRERLRAIQEQNLTRLLDQVCGSNRFVVECACG